MVLAAQGITHALVARQDAEAANPPVACEALAEQSIEIHRLVRAVESSDAEMHYADAYFAVIVVRDGYPQVGQVGRVQLHRTAPLTIGCDDTVPLAVPVTEATRIQSPRR